MKREEVARAHEAADAQRMVQLRAIHQSAVDSDGETPRDGDVAVDFIEDQTMEADIVYLLWI